MKKAAFFREMKWIIQSPFFWTSCQQITRSPESERINRANLHSHIRMCSHTHAHTHRRTTHIITSRMHKDTHGCRSGSVCISAFIENEISVCWCQVWPNIAVSHLLCSLSHCFPPLIPPLSYYHHSFQLSRDLPPLCTILAAGLCITTNDCE